MTRIIGVVSGKGGVGKTTTAINLATALMHLGKESVVVDANLNTPNVSIHLGSPVLPKTLNDVLIGQKSISDVVYQHQSGLKVVPASLHSEILPDHSRLSDALLDLENRTDFAVIDMPAGMGSEAKHAMESVDEILIVTNPELAAVTDALKTIKYAESLGKKVLGIVLNRQRKESHEMKLKDVESMLNSKIIAVVPEDEKVRRAFSKKQPVVSLYPKAKASKAFIEVAANISGIKLKKRGLLSSLFGL